MTSDKAVKPGQHALDLLNSEEKLTYAEKIGRELLEHKSARGNNTTRRIDDLKYIWKNKDN